MLRTLDMLVRGQPEIVDYYRKAAARWQEIWAKPEAEDWESLARVLSDEHAWFEENCGGPQIGSEVMVVSGLVPLYTLGRGFGGNKERARRLHDAFQISDCGIEARAAAGEIAQSYELLRPNWV
jgi:hypothetical protein